MINSTNRDHYTARLTVHRVTKTLSLSKVYNERTRSSEDVTTVTNRESMEIAGLTFTAATPSELADKISKHVELITDGEADADA